ncbi:MAG: hypothetical protein JJE16_00480 [Nitrospiraceae bacterium]|nr:hypothetical protein [Nitrospiraceae bacterium]
MRKKSKEEILEGFLWDLEKMRPTLQTLFRLARKAQKDLDGPLRPQPQRNLLDGMQRGAMLDRAQEIYAASIFLVLDLWIKKLRKSLDLEHDKTEFGEQVSRTRLAPLIKATANNFRHYYGWAEPSAEAIKSIRIIDAAGIRNFRDSNISPLVLQVLEVDTYEELEAKVRGIGQEMLNRALGRLKK